METATRKYDYAIVTPVCNEQDHLEATIDSILDQSRLPVAWIIVDDGSTDRSLEIMQTKTAAVPWVEILRRPDKGRVGLSRGEALTAFHAGLDRLTTIPHDYVAKVDGDLVLDRDYFERLLTCCAAEPELGIVSGSFWETTGSGYRLQRAIGGSAWAAARLYRVACLADIGPVAATAGWDMVDILRARTRGWRAAAFFRPRFFHRRHMGSKGGILRGKSRYGTTSFLLRYDLLYFLARLVFQLFKTPYVLGSLAMLGGYLAAAARRNPPIVDAREKRELHRMQRKALGRIFFRSAVTPGYR